jgi:hypothetical protein
MSDYASFVADFHDHLTSNPNARVFLGLTNDLGSLPDPSAARQAADVEASRVLLARCEALAEETSPSDFDRALDLDLAGLRLAFDIHYATFRFNGRDQATQCPRAGDDVGDGIFMMFINDPREPAERLRDITERLEATPAYIEALLARTEVPVARWVAIDDEKVQGLPSLFDTLENWARSIAWDGLDGFLAARANAEAALTDYRTRLAALPTTDHLHMGPEAAQELIRLKGIDRTLDDLHVMARDFLAETGATIERLRVRLAAKYELDANITTADLHTWLSERFRLELPDGKLEAILDRYQEEREKLLAWIRELDLFPLPDDHDMTILRTPGFMAPSIPAGAMMPPAPFRSGTKRSLVYLTLSEELRDEHTELGIPGMMVHEGIPGHHLQLATAAGHSSVVRRHVDAAEHAEGWTTMLEDYILDLGYMGRLEDEARFIGKRDISRIGARVAIDLFFMTGDRAYLDVGVECDTSSDDPFVAAGNLLEAVTGFVPGRVQAEINWYSQERGYPLSYLTGNRMVWQMKHEIATAQAGKFEGLELDRTFHRIYLESGNMPLTRLRRVFQHEGLLPAS